MKCMTDISFHNKESYMFLYKIYQEKMSVIMAVCYIASDYGQDT